MEKTSKPNKSPKGSTPVSPDPSRTPTNNENPLAANSLPTPASKLLFLTNDSTSHYEISFMKNDKYSEEIIKEADNAFNLDKLRALENNKTKYLNEAKHQIAKLLSSVAALEVHTKLFQVSFLINIGYILNEIEPNFPDRHAFIAWRSTNFNLTPEYFQHARRLVHMGDTAIKFRSLGVNRLLEVDRLQTDLKKPIETILSDHRFPDTAIDVAGDLFKTQVDSIISYYRYMNAGVDKITLVQVYQMVQFTHKDIPVKEVNRFKKIYDKTPDKDALLKKYVMDKGVITSQEPSESVSGNSLNKMLADINSYFQNKGMTNSDWVDEQREILDRNILKAAFDNIKWLKKKLK